VLPKVYIETSVISYLVARRNQCDLLVAANQELTQEWWETRRQSFELYASAVVLAEAARGDRTFAEARMAVARELALVEVSPAAIDLAQKLLQDAGLPGNASEDALHIAIASAGGLDYLLTWNCRHIANAVIIPRVNRVVRHYGFEPPLICTPHELIEDSNDAR
jgi:predicted nucleic acid-binding protein